MKKIFLTAALFISLSGATYAAPGGETDSVAGSAATVENVGIAFDVADLASPAEDDEPVVAESNVARKMTQAEKAHNAAVNDSWGGAITIVAMIIVVMALFVLSILFLGFGKISESLMSKKKRQSSSNAQAAGAESTTRPEVDSGDVIAAIAMALSEHFGEGHDMEETILTIRRMKKAYSPWNSKIYNIRQMPDIDRNTPSRSAF